MAKKQLNAKQIANKYLPAQTKFVTYGNLILFEVSTQDIAKICVNLYKIHRLPIKTSFALDDCKTDKSFKIFYVFGIPKGNYFLVPYIKLQNTTEFPSLTPQIHELSLYEREIYTFFGLKATGHPKLTRTSLHDNWPDNIYPLRKDFKWNTRPKMDKKNTYQFNVIKGEGIYEIPVGPIHAGIIEPGHFRFSVAGEEIVALEPQLGYVHKGIEKLFETLPLDQKIKLSERVSGDSSFNHSLAFCQALESLANTQIPDRARYLRLIFAELERLANHFNDFAFIMMDTAFTFGGSQGTRLREIVMQLIEKLAGNRYMRGANILGGVSVDISGQDQSELLESLKKITEDFDEVLEVTLDSTSMMNRLKGSGILNKQVALDHGAVGITARASGIERDARIDYPYAAYPDLGIKIALQEAGDVRARFRIRIEEIYTSLNIIQRALNKIPAGSIKTEVKNFPKNSYAIGITEGWRGDIVYFVITDEKGEITRVVVRDPSYLNWRTIPHTVVGNPVPEFPLINKSFNLSYSGNDK